MRLSNGYVQGAFCLSVRILTRQIETFFFNFFFFLHFRFFWVFEALI